MRVRAARFGENQLARGGVPLVRMRRADIIIDLPLGQQAEFVGTPLLDDLQIGMRFAQAGDMLRRFGRLVRPRHGHPQGGDAPLPLRAAAAASP